MKKELLTSSQRKYILSELGHLRLDRYNSKPKTPREPPSVREARRKRAVLQKKISAWERAQEKRIVRLIAARDREISAVRQEVNFGTPESALRMLEALQKKARK